MQSAVWRFFGSRHTATVVLTFACLVARPVIPLGAQEVTREIRNFSDSLDVPFVPSEYVVLDAMFDLARPTKDDFVIDLGSGDGRIVITAVKTFGARGYGVDLNGGLVKIANARAAEAGVADRARFYVRDLFKEDIRRASIVTMFLFPEVVLQLRPKLFAQLRPGSRIVSHDYHLGDWKPDATRWVDVGPPQNMESIVYYWVVPAKVSGNWVMAVDWTSHFNEPLEYRAIISQHFQDIDGKVDLNSQTLRIHDARLSGDRILFSATGEIEERIIRHDFAGVVKGHTITGSVRLSGAIQEATLPWLARRSNAED